VSLKEDKVCWKSSRSVGKCSEVKWKSPESEVKWSEVQCGVSKGEKWGFMGKVDMSCKVVRSEGMGLKCDCNLCGKIYYKLHTTLSYLVFYTLYMWYLKLSCEYGC